MQRRVPVTNLTNGASQIPSHATDDAEALRRTDLSLARTLSAAMGLPISVRCAGVERCPWRTVAEDSVFGLCSGQAAIAYTITSEMAERLACVVLGTRISGELAEELARAVLIDAVKGVEGDFERLPKLTNPEGTALSARFAMTWGDESDCLFDLKVPLPEGRPLSKSGAFHGIPIHAQAVLSEVMIDADVLGGLVPEVHVGLPGASIDDVALLVGSANTLFARGEMGTSSGVRTVRVADSASDHSKP